MGTGRKHKICVVFLLVSVFLISCAANNIKKESEPLKNIEVTNEFKKIMPKLEDCYKNTIVGKKGFYGKGLLVLKIGKDGKVNNYNWKPVPPDNFIICTDTVIKNIRFRKLPDTVRLEIPVSFVISVEDKK